MATRLTIYRMTDGLTRLGEDYFNAIWADLDLRLDALEKVRADWKAAVSDIQAFGLDRIDSTLVPVLNEARSLLQTMHNETDVLAQSLVNEHLQPLVVEFQAVLAAAQADAAALKTALDESNWQQQLDMLTQFMLGGMVPGWNYGTEIGSGTAEQPETQLFWNGEQGVKLSSVYNENGFLQTCTVANTGNFTANPTPWLVQGTLNVSYDQNDNITGAHWT